MNPEKNILKDHVTLKTEIIAKVTGKLYFQKVIFHNITVFTVFLIN